MRLARMTTISDPPRPDLEAGVAAVKKLGAFPGANDRQLRIIVEAGQLVSIPKNWSMVWEGTPGDKAYVVLSGTASVRHDHVEFATINPGEWLGEMAIVQHRLRSATVVAVTDVEALHFTRETVELLQREVPAFAEAVVASTTNRVA